MRDPLTERDYAEIRAAVMSEVRRRGRRRSTPWQLALVPAAVVLAIVLSPRNIVKYDTQPSARPVLVQPVAPQQQAVVMPVAQHKTHPVRKHHKQEVIQTASAAITRIDIQTADPDVRIIWFARQEDSK